MLFPSRYEYNRYLLAVVGSVSNTFINPDLSVKANAARLFKVVSCNVKYFPLGEVKVLVVEL
ncbi:hypothetical protein [Niallia sp. Marseille-Q9988]